MGDTFGMDLGAAGDAGSRFVLLLGELVWAALLLLCCAVRRLVGALLRLFDRLTFGL